MRKTNIAKRRNPADEQLEAIRPRPSQLSKVEFVKIEKNLASLGFFTPSSKRVRNEKSKNVTFIKVIDGKRIEAKAIIAPATLYGLPITADQDKYLAFQKLLNDQQRRDGKITNPIGFSTADLLKILRVNDAGKNYRDVAEWLKVMTATTIVSEGTVFFANQKRWISDAFHCFDRAVSMGKQLPDGSIADRNYVWLSDWQLENINSNHLLPVDLDTYRELKTHIAKGLVPLLQIWLYASRDDGAYTKRYDELCQVLHLRQYQHVSKITEKLGPSLNELQSHGYLASWSIERTTDGKNYKIIFRHGEKFHRDRQRRLGLGETAPEVLPEPEEPQSRDDESGTRDSESIADTRLEALIARGVTRKHASRLLLSVDANQPVLDQLEWGDTVIARDPSKVQNPAGLYISFVRDNISVPKSFETTRKRGERVERETARAAEQRRQDRLKDAYRDYQEKEIARYVEALSPDRHEALLSIARAELLSEHPRLRHLASEEQLAHHAETRLFNSVASEVPLRSFQAFCKSHVLPPGADGQ
ncbi:MAG: replication initiator protein A [Acidobacteriota bacterium]